METNDLKLINKKITPIFDPVNKSRFTPYFWEYHRRLMLANNRLKYIRLIKSHFDLARFDPKKKTILDAGAGFGISCFVMRLLGAKAVYGIEINKLMVKTFKKILGSISSISGVYFKYGEVTHTEYYKNTFDFIMANETVSHFSDCFGFLKESWRILKPGGILFISDSNNGLNPFRIWRSYKIWSRTENGPPGTVFGHKVSRPYRQTRALIIKKLFPEFKKEEIDRLALGTFGYTFKQIIDACRIYKTSHIAPRSYYCFGVPSLDPVTGQYNERLIHPIDLTNQMKRIGFKCRIYAYIGGAGGNFIIRVANNIAQKMGLLAWPFGRALRVVAIKPG